MKYLAKQDLRTNLVLVLDGGIANGKQVFKNKTYSKVKTDSLDDDVLGVARVIGALMETTVIENIRVNYSKLFQE